MISGTAWASFFDLLDTCFTLLFGTLFDVLEIGSAAGGYASVKAFEALAFLLHEPRLRSEVPLFCIIAIKPILSADVTSSVSVGAVQLLVHLHSRLEVLIDSENSSSDGSVEEPQTPDAPSCRM